MQLLPVPIENLPNALPDFERWLGPVTQRPGCDLDLPALLDIVEREQGQLVALVDADEVPVALGVLQVRDHESGLRSCWVLAVGGKRVAAWSAVLSQIEAGARRNGCSSVEFVGRRAWMRLLPLYTATPCECGIHFSKALGH